MTSTVTSEEFRRAMRRWPTGVAIITARLTDGKAEGMTVNSLISISLDPPLLMVSLTRDSRTLVGVTASNRFGVSILGTGTEELCWSFARAREARDFEGFSDDSGVPLADRANARMVCRVQDTIPISDHVLVIGEVQLIEVEEEELDPLIFHEGALRDFGAYRHPLDLFEGW